MKARTRATERSAVPQRDVLELLARHYHQLQNEHKRAAPGSGIRRRIESRLLEVREEFDRTLAEWVPDEELQATWRDFLKNRTPEPPAPLPIAPVVFRGVSDAGSVAELRGDPREEVAVEIDGSLAERIVAAKDLASSDPSLVLRIDGTDFRETFSASKTALQALADFVDDDDSPPPWEHAAELLEDGLIDVHAALTRRGRRALARLRG
jgi:hypothetical protein